jgi:hypothetical protein
MSQDAADAVELSRRPPRCCAAAGSTAKSNEVGLASPTSLQVFAGGGASRTLRGPEVPGNRRADP